MFRKDIGGRCGVARATGALAVLIAFGASAQSTEAPDPLHPSLRACAVLKDDLERLACYDRAVETIASGAATNAPAATPQDMFGMDPELSRETSKQEPVKRETLPEITAKVTGVRTSAIGQTLIELDNGQVWQPTEEKRTLVIKAGDSVTISRAALGTFRLVTSDKRSARVKRVR